MAAMLLAAGADPNLRQRHDGRLTPLQMVVDRKNFNMEIAAMLLKHGADPNVPPSGADGPTLLYRLCAGSSLDETQQLQLLRVLLADPRTTLTDPGRDNRSLLSLALECRRSAAFAAGFAERLGQFGPKDPVLHYAVLGDYPESLLREVIAKKANVNAVENDKTPLWVAKEKGMDDVVKLLLAHGADPEWRNSKGASLRDVKPTAPVNRKLPAERGRESTR